MTAADLIQRYQLKLHPEGGHYAETFRSNEQFSEDQLPERYQAPRTLYTSIYFMLQKGQISALHRLNSDEIWYHHAGGTLEVSIIFPGGRLQTSYLGSGSNAEFQLLLPRHTWFGAKVIEGDFSFLGCTVAPGFDFTDFELGTRTSLLASFPEHKERILKLTL